MKPKLLVDYDEALVAFFALEHPNLNLALTARGPLKRNVYSLANARPLASWVRRIGLRHVLLSFKPFGLLALEDFEQLTPSLLELQALPKHRA